MKIMFELKEIFDEYIKRGSGDWRLYDILEEIARKVNYKVKTRREDSWTTGSMNLIEHHFMPKLKKLKIPVARNLRILSKGYLKLIFEPHGWYINSLTGIKLPLRMNVENAKKKLKEFLDLSYSIVEKRKSGQNKEAQNLLNRAQEILSRPPTN